jgi:hypothetical protein
MNQEGPALETLTRRLAECPPEFLAEPRIGGLGSIQVAAVVSDLLRELGGSPLTPAEAAAFQSDRPKTDRNRLSLALLGCWVLHDLWFRARPGTAAIAQRFLAEGLIELAQATPAGHFVSDPDRREELARVCLRELGLRPAGETLAQANDRLMTLNAAERARVVKAARKAEQRAADIREAMRCRAEEEANAKATRE